MKKTFVQFKKDSFLNLILKLFRIKERFISVENTKKYLNSKNNNLNINLKHKTKNCISKIRLSSVGSMNVVYMNEDHSEHNIILYLHGGAFVEACSSLHFSLMDKIAQESHSTVVCPLYPRLPNTNGEELLKLLRLLLNQTIQNSNRPIILMGDSAGGWLVLSLAQIIRDEFSCSIAHCILFSPWIDLRMNNINQELEKKDHILSYQGLRYLGQLLNPDLSCGYKMNDSLEGCGQLHVFVSKNEILYEQVKQVYENSKLLKVIFNLYEYEGLFHDFVLFPFKQSNEVIQEVVKLINQK